MSSIKSFLLKLYTFPRLSKRKANFYQKKIRDAEWDSFSFYIKENIKLVDVGCGSGYYLKKAIELKNSTVFGVDPEPGSYGVNRNEPGLNQDLNIIKGFAENIPLESNNFDVILSSHVLEHVNDISKSLEEMKRIGKSDATFIIGMPTSQMAIITLLTHILFESHIRFVNFFFSPFINVSKVKFKQLFFSYSHSYPKNKTIIYDILNYRSKVWSRHIKKHLKITKVIYPALYPPPSYLQLFRLIRLKKNGCAVYFICKK